MTPQAAGHPFVIHSTSQLRQVQVRSVFENKILVARYVTLHSSISMWCNWSITPVTSECMCVHSERSWRSFLMHGWILIMICNVFGWNDNFPLSGPCRISHPAVVVFLTLYHINSKITFFALDGSQITRLYMMYVPLWSPRLCQAHTRLCGWLFMRRGCVSDDASTRAYLRRVSSCIMTEAGKITHTHTRIYPYVAIIACQAECRSWSIKSFLPMFAEPVILVTCSHRIAFMWCKSQHSIIAHYVTVHKGMFDLSYHPFFKAISACKTKNLFLQLSILHAYLHVHSIKCAPSNLHGKQ